MESGRERQESTKTRLLEAAGEVFSEKGFRAATVRDICSRAGTNVSAVNYHFRDKEGLYVAVLEYSHVLALRKYPPDWGLREGASAEERLHAFILSFLLRFLAEGFPSWHGKLMAQEITDPTRALKHVVEKAIRPLFNSLVEIVEELIPVGEGAGSAASEAAYLCAMSVVGQCVHRYVSRHVTAFLRPNPVDTPEIEQLADHITRFSIGGIREIASRLQPREVSPDGLGEDNKPL